MENSLTRWRSEVIYLPSVYEFGGVQYAVMAVGGGNMGTAEGDTRVAFRIKN